MLSALSLSILASASWTLLPAHRAGAQPSDVGLVAAASVGRYLPFELLLLHDDSAYGNPFWDVEIQATFWSPGGTSYRVEGFFYQHDDSALDQWMVRFAPPVLGTWGYWLRVEAPDDSFTTTGTFQCVPSNLHGPLRVHPTNQRRLVHDDGTAFNALGTNLFTYENPFLDGEWIHTDDPPGVRWAAYFAEYGAHGCNAYRRVLGNEQPPDPPFMGQVGIWQGAGPPEFPRRPDAYHLDRAKKMDIEFLAARQHNIALIVALLDRHTDWGGNPLNAANGGPIQSAGYPADLLSASNSRAVPYFEKYLRYVVNRYAAFVDVWELFNEWDESQGTPAYGLNVPWKARMARVVRDHHPYHDLVCTTRPGDEGAVNDGWQDLRAAHRYLSDPRADVFDHPSCVPPYDPTACARSCSSILAGLASPTDKPHLIDEFGFGPDMVNDDPDCFRIAAWTALHLDSGLLLWDTNLQNLCGAPVYAQGKATSAYVSALTRDFFGIRQRYAARMPQTVQSNSNPPTGYDSSRLDVFGLEDPTAGIYSCYVHDFRDHVNTTTGKRLTIRNLPFEPHEAVWIDPKTGELVSSGQFGGFRGAFVGDAFDFAVPPFRQDIALLIRPDGPVEILTTSLAACDVGAPVSVPLQARGGGMPYSWSIVGGALPCGMQLDGGTGMLGGTPVSCGAHRFTVQVRATDGSVDQVSLAVEWRFVAPSLGAEDGLVVESSAASGRGGFFHAGLEGRWGLVAGDDAQRRKVQSVLSFDTSALPEGAVVDEAALILTSENSVTGGLASLSPLALDVQTGSFGARALESTDFEAPATVANAGGLVYPFSTSEPLVLLLNGAGRAALNRTGRTQFRLHWSVRSDGDASQDLIGFYPGDHAVAAKRPRLRVLYH